MATCYWVLVLLAWCTCSSGQDLFADTGLLAEYFAPLDPEESCVPGEGSLKIFENKLPTLVRREASLNFEERRDFNIKRCAWERDTEGKLRYECRGEEEMLKTFAARYTGYIYIYLQGYYNFELEVDDGGRVIIGHDVCPGLSCANRYNVTNFDFSELRSTNVKGDVAHAKHCEQCSFGIYIDCWVTRFGCEPFSLWQLEADGGSSGNCSFGDRRKKVNSTRYLTAGLHPVRIEYFQRSGTGVLVWRYSGPDTDGQMRPVPFNKLGFPKSSTFRKEVFDVDDLDMSGLPSLSQHGLPPEGAKLLYTVDDKFQLTGAGEGEFSAELEKTARATYIRWSGFMLIKNGGDYGFGIESDDGGRVTLGGRGYGGEKIVVETIGLQETPTRKEQRGELLPGLHAIRIEYFWKPNPLAVAMSLPRPPGIKVDFTGPDTREVDVSISHNNAAIISMHDYQCELRYFHWGDGMASSRDCTGKCFEGFEDVVGDGICDNGLFGTNSLDCFAYNFDNKDCDPEFVQVVGTTVRPIVECQQSCTFGDWKRKDCQQCSKLSDDGLTCLASYDESCGTGRECSFLNCCVAKVTGVNYWGEDCIAYGTTTNCTYELEHVLDELQFVQLPMDARAQYDPLKDRPRPEGELLVDCNRDRCNEITTEKKINPFTGLEMQERFCPVEESPLPGLNCYIGPFDVVGVTNVETQCQDQKFEYNFCKGTRSIDGRPFERCCNFLYINAQDAVECRMEGVAQGTCDVFLQELIFNKSASIWTTISNALVIQECFTDYCNNPMDEAFGCPQIVDKAPAITDGIRPTDEPSLEQILKGSVERPPDPPPWGLIGGLCAIPFALVCMVWFVSKVFAAPPEPLWHSTSAKVVADDTFIEPTQDHYTHGKLRSHLNSELTYGKVEARPFGLQLQKDEEIVIPYALRQHPDVAVPEATNASWTDAIAFEANLEKCEPDEIHQLPAVAKGTTFTGAGNFQPLENIDAAGHKKEATGTSRPQRTLRSSTEASESEGHQALVIPGSERKPLGSGRIASTGRSHAISDRPSRDPGTTRSASSVSQSLSAYRGAIVEADDDDDESVMYQADLPEPPTPPPVPEIGHVEPSVSGLALNQVSVGNLHRPAAVARMMRKQQGHPGAPRVAT